MPGAISPAGNVDTWTFFGRAGEVITTYVNPGTGSVPVPISPNLNWVGVQLLGPGNQVLASGASATSGAAVSLANVTLPADGTYSILINAAASHPTSTGNYVVAAFDVTPRIAPLGPGAELVRLDQYAVCTSSNGPSRRWPANR